MTMPRSRSRPRNGRRAVAGALATLVVAGACEAGDPPARETSAGAETGAALILVEGLDEEGGTIGRALLPDSALVAFFRDHVVFADARPVAAYLGPGTRVDVAAGTLRLDGADTGIPVELRDSAAFVPLRAMAARFGAYAHIEETPGRVATLWRHDVLCRYARDADRRAAVFLGAAEQGLLRRCEPPIGARVRRWASAAPDERWAASVTLRQPLDSADATTLLERYGAAPYAAYGVVAGHHLITRVSPDSASPRVIADLGAAAIEAIERALCGLPGALQRRGPAPVARRHLPGVDAFHAERHMLASVVAARDALPRVRAGAPIVFGVDVVATASGLRRLGADPRVDRLEPATKLDDGWVLPGVDLGRAPGVPEPPDVAALDSAALFARLDAEAARAGAECSSAARVGARLSPSAPPPTPAPPRPVRPAPRPTPARP